MMDAFVLVSHVIPMFQGLRKVHVPGARKENTKSEMHECVCGLLFSLTGDVRKAERVLFCFLCVSETERSHASKFVVCFVTVILWSKIKQ